MKPLDVVQQGPFAKRAVAHKAMVQIKHQRCKKEANN